MNASKSLRGKFVGSMLLVIGLVGAPTLVLVAVLNTQAARQQLAIVRTHIEASIHSKGRVLTQNHAIAMRSMVLDNAYLDMQLLVERAVSEDSDLVYGIYVNSEKQAVAYCRRGTPCGPEQLVDKELWRTLGLTEADLEIDALRSSKVRRLGSELLEVAMPVLGEEKELAGTIRYGLSTQRMQDALAEAKAEADARLKRSLSIIGLIVGLSTLLGVFLSRFQAVKITRPVSELTRAAERLAAGDRAVRVAIDSGDELEALGGSFNKMVEELDGSYGKLEEMNRTLEEKVLARTEELAIKNRDMRLVLDNVDQGFVTLSPQGVLASERSAVVEEWFGPAQPNVKFWDFIEPHSPAFAMHFMLAWSQLEEGVFPLEMNLDQLPKQLSNPGKTFSLRYLPFLREGELEGVLVAIADITEKLQKEREEAERSELMVGFKRLMLDRVGFSTFLREASGMIAEIRAAGSSDVSRLKHTLHTLKGNAAMMGLTVVARICHGLEDQLAEHGSLTESALEELSARWSAIIQHISAFAEKQSVIEVPQAEYTALVARLSKDTHSELLAQLLSWQLEPIDRAFERLAEQARGLAQRLNKGKPTVVVEGAGIRVDSELWAPLFANLVHLVRNAVDHGLETPSERRALGKPENGSILLKAQREAHFVTIEVSDDGRGIDWPAIAERGRSLGLPVETQQQLLAALVHDGVSTRTDVSDTSGRGVGMGAVLQRIQSMNGTIDVRTSEHRGTTWVIRLPREPRVVPAMALRDSTSPPSAVPRAAPS